jgi:hypothetical protein
MIANPQSHYAVSWADPHLTQAKAGGHWHVLREHRLQDAEILVDVSFHDDEKNIVSRDLLSDAAQGLFCALSSHLPSV